MDWPASPVRVTPLYAGCQLGGHDGTEAIDGGLTRWCSGPASRNWKPLPDLRMLNLCWAGVGVGDAVRTVTGPTEAPYYVWSVVEYAEHFQGALLVSMTSYDTRATFRPDPGAPVVVARRRAPASGDSMGGPTLEQARAMIGEVLGGMEILT